MSGISEGMKEVMMKEPKNEFREKIEQEAEEIEKIEKRFIPLEDRVLCKLEDEDEIVGGIIIPDEVRETKKEAVVVAVGFGRTTEDGQVVPMRIKVGDRVMLPAYGGSDMKLKEAKYQIVVERDILGIIKDEAPEEGGQE